MKTLSVSEAKMKLSWLIDTVNATEEEVMITKSGHPAAVLVSPEEFESLKETVAVRSEVTLMKEIKRGLLLSECRMTHVLVRLTRGISVHQGGNVQAEQEEPWTSLILTPPGFRPSVPLSVY